jgi:hypothetical protein
MEFFFPLGRLYDGNTRKIVRKLFSLPFGKPQNRPLNRTYMVCTFFGDRFGEKRTLAYIHKAVFLRIRG